MKKILPKTLNEFDAILRPIVLGIAQVWCSAADEQDMKVYKPRLGKDKDGVYIKYIYNIEIDGMNANFEMEEYAQGHPEASELFKFYLKTPLTDAEFSPIEIGSEYTKVYINPDRIKK